MAQPLHRMPIRATVIDLIARAAEALPGDPMTDEDYFLAQLRAAIAPEDTPVSRLAARYGVERRCGRRFPARRFD